MKKILFLLIFLLTIFLNKSFSKQRLFIIDRGINNLNLEIDNNIDKTISESIYERFIKNNIKLSKNSDLKVSIRLLDVKSEEKKIVLSEFGEYDIIDNEVIVSAKIEIYDKENLVWNRKISKLNSQKWIDFNRLKIGSNIIFQSFYIPTQFVIDLKRKYTKEEFINITILEIINNILDNLIY